MALVSTTLFVIPAILIAACYIIIVRTIWNKGKEMSVSKKF
jgi:neuropeptide S receptor 1